MEAERVDLTGKSMLVLHVPRDVATDTIQQAVATLREATDLLVVALDGSQTLTALSDEQLAEVGLYRKEDG